MKAGISPANATRKKLCTPKTHGQDARAHMSQTRPEMTQSHLRPSPRPPPEDPDPRRPRRRPRLSYASDPALLRHPDRPRRSGTLLAGEDRLETTRTTGEGTYNLQRHVAVLTALDRRALPGAGARRSPERRRDPATGDCGDPRSPPNPASIGSARPRDGTPHHRLEPRRAPGELQAGGIAMALADALDQRRRRSSGWSGERSNARPRPAGSHRDGSTSPRRPHPGRIWWLLSQLHQPCALADLPHRAARVDEAEFAAWGR